MRTSSSWGDEHDSAQVEGKFFRTFFSNVTLFGAKCWDLFGGMADEQKPDCWCIAEAHLRGTDLNIARRRLKKLGWRSFGTQAISKIAKETGLLPNAPPEGPQGRYHNSGGEMVLLGAHLQASGITNQSMLLVTDRLSSGLRDGPYTWSAFIWTPITAWKLGPMKPEPKG